MPKESNIVHRYFRKKGNNNTILIKVNPIGLTALELTIVPEGAIASRELLLNEDIWENLKTDGFEEANALEFNLYYSGLIQ